jgi:hypothetical protein
MPKNRGDAIEYIFVVDPTCWTDPIVGYNLSRGRRGYDGTTAQIHGEIQDPGCPRPVD